MGMVVIGGSSTQYLVLDRNAECISSEQYLILSFTGLVLSCLGSTFRVRILLRTGYRRV